MQKKISEGDPRKRIAEHKYFVRKRFEALWDEEDDTTREANRKELTEAILKMCNEWAFCAETCDTDLQDPLTSDPWTYLHDHIFKLTMVWQDDDGAAFTQLRKLAKHWQGENKKNCEPIIEELAKDSSVAGKWVKKLENEGDGDNIYRGKTLTSGERDDGRECWLPKKWRDGAEMTPESERSLYDCTVLPPLLRHLARSSFDEFRGALQKALDGADMERDGSSRSARRRRRRRSLAKGKTSIRCQRLKSVKGQERMEAKITKWYEKVKEKICKWPVAATIGDSLRASVTVPNVEEMKIRYDQIMNNFDVLRVKNKFGMAVKNFHSDEELTFPNIHINVLFKAKDCVRIVAEIQIHLESIQTLMKHDHNLYEIVRAGDHGKKPERAITELQQQHDEPERARQHWEVYKDIRRAVSIMGKKTVRRCGSDRSNGSSGGHVLRVISEGDDDQSRPAETTINISLQELLLNI